MKYYSEIVAIGSEALEFLKDPDSRSLILFDYTASPDLADISILQKKKGGMGEPAKGDTLLIGNKAYTITAVGSEAPHTLAELSHCTLCFKGGEVPERPGCIMLEGDDKLTAYDIQIGTSIEIY